MASALIEPYEPRLSQQGLDFLETDVVGRRAHALNEFFTFAHADSLVI